MPDGRPLAGTGVRLELLGDDAVDELYPLLSDPQVYADGYVMHRCPVSVEDSRALVTSRFLVAGRVVYAIRLVDGTLVGTSSLLEIDLANESIHLGATLYGRRWWGTAVNPEAKLLLLAHCFDDCGFGRVKIQTDALNTHSQAAIAKLGARRAVGGRAGCGGPVATAGGEPHVQPRGVRHRPPGRPELRRHPGRPAALTAT